jgi:hypothetical protein
MLWMGELKDEQQSNDGDSDDNENKMNSNQIKSNQQIADLALVILYLQVSRENAKALWYDIVSDSAASPQFLLGWLSSMAL